MPRPPSRQPPADESKEIANNLKMEATTRSTRAGWFAWRMSKALPPISKSMHHSPNSVHARERRRWDQPMHRPWHRRRRPGFPPASSSNIQQAEATSTTTPRGAEFLLEQNRQKSRKAEIERQSKWE